MWSLSRVLVFSGAAIAGGGSGGWAIYKALWESVETTREKNNAFWNSKLDELEKELVELSKKNDNSYSDLAKKIMPTNYSPVFDLNNERNAFKHGKGESQRNALSGFCSSDRKGTINSELAKRICGEQ